jgi:uncharacterized protein (DUF2126 family)/transglutaminase-like putative cysteine protease
MSIHVGLYHRTHYRYDRPVSLSPHLVRLRPAPHSRTPIRSYSLKVEPGGHFINWQQDPFGNYLARLVFPEKVTELLVEVDVVAELVTINPFDFFLEPSADQVPFAYDASSALDLAPYLKVTESGPRLEALVGQVRDRGVGTVNYLVALNRRVQHDVRYVVRMEPGVQTPEETLTKGSGSCRDSAWLLVQVLRRLGLAARFVSGYLIQLTADQKPLDGPAGPEADFTDLHAWAEVYLPGAGWVGLDPTSGLFAGEGHIPLAATPEPSSAAPITGAMEKAETQFHFHMSVRRIHETPRVTKPYTEEQWTALDALGQQVDDVLQREDVRLTMGGEPTFVSMDDMDGPEWNTAALGPRKRVLGDQLLRRLHHVFARGGLLFHGQGKWYPGESLPRWAFGCYWRQDGDPVWTRPQLFAEDGRPSGAGVDHAQRFITRLAARLGVDANHIVPGYEDAWYYLWKERRLPANVDPFDSKLSNPEDRARLARIFEQGLDKTVGFALPLRRAWNGPRWISGPWFLRPERMYLIPGDSPMGFRLPIDSLPWVAEGDYPHVIARDPLAPRAGLEPRARIVAQFAKKASPPAAAPARAPADASDTLVRTALVAESRNGHLHLFMPPVQGLEDYLELVAAIEETAAELDQPLFLEGYPPPHDPRLEHIKVTPDPGVIEVNTQPAESWRELEHITTSLYEQARQCRLGTEKFMLDGRHTGTGGGNHVVLGGPTPADSPLLRRPDLLGSLVSYWHNHPSLSYLFSCLFIGPTSQAPRVDDARNDALYELELALKQTPGGTATAPWLVDRIYRNLLVDVTGNTHRAEFCIDKLYAPETASGRLGLLELRALEMPPHARMSLAQQLLVRGLVAWFWREPYRAKLARWGTEVHDKFMLPHFVWQDFEDVLHDLNQAGFGFQADWFRPHLEFRFPFFGEIVAKGAHVELRQALEPWPVLGEEPAGGGTVRFVDSSLERVQVKVSNFDAARYQVACNGVETPLFPTGRAGEFVAGVRYRAWQPASCLHPTIGVHTPLVFDVVDTWNARAIGGCTYHVAHPGGRNYTTFPVNALEAESRRIARFTAFGHTPGPLAVQPTVRSLEFPMTLDLRRAGG